MAFSAQARMIVDGALIRCEERYPNDAPHSVLLVVVERDAPFYREKLAPAHAGLFGPGKSDPLAPVQLEVIDRATDDALARLIAAGLITKNTRTSRPLFPADEPATKPLSLEEKAQIVEHKNKAAHSLKLGNVLASADFLAEAQPHWREALLATAGALAIQNRAPAPAAVDGALRPPASLWWGQSAEKLRAFTLSHAPDAPHAPGAWTAFRDTLSAAIDALA
jgi:hypothetical protein